jgi:hypothetical protein
VLCKIPPIRHLADRARFVGGNPGRVILDQVTLSEHSAFVGVHADCGAELIRLTAKQATTGDRITIAIDLAMIL